MHQLRRLIISATILAMAVMTLGAPVSAAAPGKVALVNGIPGASIDVCINNNEVSSNLRYGQKAFRTLAAGTKRLKTYRSDPRTCRGAVLAMQSFDLLSGKDRTIVVTKGAPKILDFDNATFGTVGAPVSLVIMIWRNASDIASVSLNYEVTPLVSGPITPAADPIWQKGDQFFGLAPSLFGAVHSVATVFSIADTATILGKPDVRALTEGYRYEWILIGTKASNAKLVVYRRPLK